MTLIKDLEGKVSKRAFCTLRGGIGHEVYTARKEACKAHNEKVGFYDRAYEAKLHRLGDEFIDRLTLEDIADWCTEKDVLKWHNVGKVRLEEVKEVMKQYGLELKKN